MTDATTQRGRTDAETCLLNGWAVGTVLRGQEQWSGGEGVWTTIRITAIGEESILCRAIWNERTGPLGVTLSWDRRTDREGLWTLADREWNVAEDQRFRDGKRGSETRETEG